MGQPYVGEIRMFAGNFAPAGWNFCDGSLLAISDFDTLFNLIGTTYGGDGQSTFAVPDLRGRLPLHQGTGGGATYSQGQSGGTETVTLTIQQIPSHTHSFICSGDTGSQPTPSGMVPATSNVVSLYSGSVAAAAMASQALTNAGGSQPHSNFQPYLCVDFIISLFGIFPSQN